MDNEILKYRVYDLGYGLHISLNVELYDPLIPNLFVVQNSIAKINTPKCDDLKEWDLKWEQLKTSADDICDHLNSGYISEFDAAELVDVINNHGVSDGW